MYTIVIVGVGYVGLVSGTCFAEMGNHVLCLDKDKEKIEKLQSGIIPIYEPGLSELVARNAKTGRLAFTTDYAKAIKEAEICVLAVDTPMGFDNACDLSSLKACVRQIAKEMNGYKLIITKSTVPVGCAKIVKGIISEVLEARGVSFSFDVVSNPEFLKEGSAVSDFMKPDRVVIGAESERAFHTMRELYRPFMLGSDRLLEMDTASAELTKYAANCMLALRVSFMNWLSTFCEKTGANILQIRKGIGTDRRIGSSFLWAGAGFGGSCFPKDIKALKVMAESLGIPTRLIDAIDEINEAQKKVIGSKIARYFEPRGGIKDKTIAILGLSFKPDTDDMREAPSLVLIKELLDQGANLRLYDPGAMENARKIVGDHPHIHWCQNEYETAASAHAIALMTEWKQFRLLDFTKMKEVMAHNAFFDGRNQYCPKEMGKIGFDYFSIGQAPVLSVFEKEFFQLEAANAL